MKNLLTIILTLAFSISAFAGETIPNKKDTSTNNQQDTSTNNQQDTSTDHSEESTSEQDSTVKKKSSGEEKK